MHERLLQPQQTLQNIYEVGRDRAFQALALAGSMLALMGAEKANAQSRPLPAKTIGNLYTPLTPESIPSGITDQQQLNALGAEMVNALPGQSVDFNQQTASVEVAPGQATAKYVCSPIASKQKYPNIYSATVLENNQASLTFCPSNKAIDITAINPSSSLYQKAFQEFKSDPVRNTEWAGDRLKDNLFVTCPTDPLEYDPMLAAKVKRNKKVSVTFNSLSTMQYCDKVGQYSTEASAQVRKRGSHRFKQLGHSALHLDGLKEIFVFGSSQYYPSKYQRVREVLPGSRINCHARGMKGAVIRVKLVERFEGMDGQHFVHGFNNNNFVDKSKYAFSRKFKVC